MTDTNWRSKTCEGEFCSMCGEPAAAKVGEEIFSDDPNQNRHNLTAYVCAEHFVRIMGPAAKAMFPKTVKQRVVIPEWARQYRWHWLQSEQSNPVISEWDESCGLWEFSGDWFTSEEVHSHGWTYMTPVIPPQEQVSNIVDSTIIELPVCSTCDQPEYCRGNAECHYTGSPMVNPDGSINTL